MNGEGSDKPPKSPWAKDKKGQNDERPSTPEEMSEMIFKRFRAKLIAAGGKSFETFSVRPDGYLEIPEENPKSPGLLNLSPGEKKVVQGETSSVTTALYTRDHLREGARRIMKEFPDISFGFEESSARDEITYTVSLKTND